MQCRCSDCTQSADSCGDIHELEQFYQHATGQPSVGTTAEREQRLTSNVLAAFAPEEPVRTGTSYAACMMSARDINACWICLV